MNMKETVSGLFRRLSGVVWGFLPIPTVLLSMASAPPLAAQEARSFADLYPYISAEQTKAVFSPEGLTVTNEKAKVVELVPWVDFMDELSEPVFKRNPSFLVETLMVLPRTGAKLLDVYNAVGSIRGLKGRLYHSATRDQDVPLFEDATRIESDKKTSTLVADPPPARFVPASETLYLRLKDVNFGNSYYRADITRKGSGLIYRLSNFRTISYLFFTVIKEDRFIIQFYFEPLSDGLLIYCVAGAEASAFVASQVDMPSAVKKRLDVILGWMVEGVKKGSGIRG